MPIIPTRIDSQMVGVNQMMNQVAIRDTNLIADGTWLRNSDKLNKVQTLKELALGNCRLLYGSERFKFYDICICEDELNAEFYALLTCNMDGTTKILRKEVHSCAVEAVTTMTLHLQKDTAALLTKFDIGSQLRGQQGHTNEETGAFELEEWIQDNRREGPPDDTKSLAPNTFHGVPRGPRERDTFKRPRQDRGLPYED